VSPAAGASVPAGAAVGDASSSSTAHFFGAAFGLGCNSTRGLSTVNGCDGALGPGATALAGGGGGTRFAGGSSDAAGSREWYPKGFAPANVSSKADLLGGFGGAGGVGVLGLDGGGFDGALGPGATALAGGCDGGRGAAAELPAAEDEAVDGGGSAGNAPGPVGADPAGTKAPARQVPVSGSLLSPSAASDFEGRAANSALVTSPRCSFP